MMDIAMLKNCNNLEGHVDRVDLILSDEDGSAPMGKGFLVQSAAREARPSRDAAGLSP